MHVIKKHKRQVSDLLATNNGKLLVSVSWDNTARLWSISDGKEAGLFQELMTYPFNCIALDPNEKYVALGGWKKHIYVWDILVNKKHAVSQVFLNYDKMILRLLNCLTLSWRGSLSYRNQSVDLLSKSTHQFLYNRDLRNEKVKPMSSQSYTLFQCFWVSCSFSPQ